VRKDKRFFFINNTFFIQKIRHSHVFQHKKTPKRVFFVFLQNNLKKIMEQRGFNQNSGIPVVTKNLIIINALLWLSSVLIKNVDLTNIFGLHFPGTKDFYVFQFITYMFMHGSFSHIFFNMFAVFMFGRVLEYTWGVKRFLIYYFITGIGAGIVQELVWLSAVYSIALENGAGIVELVRNAPVFNLMITIGASGSVFGILLAFGMLFPNAQMFIIPFPFPIKAKYLVIGYGLIELFAGIVNFRGDNVAHFAHLGGMLFGIILILYWRKKDKGKYSNERFY
jgi:membrane associated rhomboid family serine protease